MSKLLGRMVVGAGDEQFDQGFRLGCEVGRVEGLAFAGIPRVVPWTLGAEFRFRRSWFDSYLDYERNVLDDLRRVQKARCLEQMAARDLHPRLALASSQARLARHDARQMAWPRRLWARRIADRTNELGRLEDLLEDCRHRADSWRKLEERISDELRKVRQAVDAELEAGRGRACMVDAMRLEPNPPRGVREYRDIGEFLREDPRRAMRKGRDLSDAGGMDFGYRWRLEDPIARWGTTTWRVSWLNDSTYEVYAVEFIDGGWTEGRRIGSVWLLGALLSRGQVTRTIGELERYAQRERNSLVAVARAVHGVSASAASDSRVGGP